MNTSITAPSRMMRLAAATGMVFVFATAFIIIGPSWQILDDAYYAMLADGYGMVNEPVAAIPYMHPLIGVVLELFRNVGLVPSYPLFLGSLLALVAAVLGYCLARTRSGLVTWALAIGAFLPVALSLQYTLVSGLLTAAASILLAGPNRDVPSVVAWAISAVFLWLAALLRTEMVVMAALCMFVPLLLSAWRDRTAKAWLIRFGLMCVAVGAGVLAADLVTANHRLDAFYHLNNPMAVLMNYGFIEALQIFKSPLPDPYHPRDIDLMASWFFADLHLMTPAYVDGLTASVPIEHVLKVRYWVLLESRRVLLSTYWFWLLIGALVMSIATQERRLVASGVGIFAVLYLASALVLKPLPERVAAGMAMGLFLLALAKHGASAAGTSERDFSTAKVLAAFIVIILMLIFVTDRRRIEAEGAAWRVDRSVLGNAGRIYYFPGSLPLRSAFLPLGERQELPSLIPLGSMYFTPEVLDSERALDCGGFVRCLLAGKHMSLIAGDKDVQRLSAWVAERHGRKVVVWGKVQTRSFQLQTISTVGSDQLSTERDPLN